MCAAVEQASAYLCESLAELLEFMEVESYVLLRLEDPELGNPSTSGENAESLESGESSPKRRKIDQETFHNKLRYWRFVFLCDFSFRHSSDNGEFITMPQTQMHSVQTEVFPVLKCAWDGQWNFPFSSVLSTDKGISHSPV